MKKINDDKLPQANIMQMFIQASVANGVSRYEKLINLFSLNGVTLNDYLISKDKIEERFKDIENFYNGIRLYIFIFFIITLLVALVHISLVGDYISLARLIAQLWGFCGAILTTWGYAIRSDIPKPVKAKPYIPSPRSISSSKDYINTQCEYSEAIESIWKNSLDIEESRQKVESRKKISLIPGFTLVALSFICQVPLNFSYHSIGLVVSYLFLFLGSLLFLLFVYADIIGLLDFIAGFGVRKSSKSSLR